LVDLIRLNLETGTTIVSDSVCTDIAAFINFTYLLTYNGIGWAPNDAQPSVKHMDNVHYVCHETEINTEK